MASATSATHRCNGCCSTIPKAFSNLPPCNPPQVRRCFSNSDFHKRILIRLYWPTVSAFSPVRMHHWKLRGGWAAFGPFFMSSNLFRVAFEMPCMTGWRATATAGLAERRNVCCHARNGRTAFWTMAPQPVFFRHFMAAILRRLLAIHPLQGHCRPKFLNYTYFYTVFT